MTLLAHRLLARTTLGILLVASSGAAAQRRPFYYPDPPSSSVRITRDVEFAREDTLSLRLDVYRPANPQGPAPALVFHILYWPGQGAPARQSYDWVAHWASVAAAHGIVAVVADLRAAPNTGNATTRARALGDDFKHLMVFLTKHASAHGIDRDRIAVFANSGDVAAALPAVEDPAMTAVRAAVMYYGSGPVTTFRVDLPILFVRSGLDAPGTNDEILRLVSLAASQNAPVTLLNHHTGHHAFESRDDDVATREVMDRTIEFVKRATAPGYQRAIAAKQLEAVAAGQISVGRFGDAARTYAQLLTQRPMMPI